MDCFEKESVMIRTKEFYMEIAEEIVHIVLSSDGRIAKVDMWHTGWKDAHFDIGKILEEYSKILKETL